MMRIPSNETWMLLDSRSIGGIETHVLHLARELQSEWGSVRVVFYEDHGDHPLYKLLNDSGIAWEHLDGSVRALFAALSQRPRLLHTHGYKAGILGRLVALYYGIPVVSTFHAGDPGVGKVRIYNILDALTAKLGVAIAVSLQIQHRIFGDAHLVRNFVPMPIPAGPIPGPEAAPTVGGQRPVVAFVGRLSAEKGPDLFCKMAKSLPELDFVVYGDGPMRVGLEKKYSGRVRFLGQVVSMETHWSDIGLLCMSSRHEGLPYAALEAMAEGIPVAAFDVGSLAKLINHGCNGWIASPGETTELAGCIRRWSELENTKLVGMSAAAQKTIQENFTPAVVVPQIIAIYQKVLSANNHKNAPFLSGGKPW